jgi:hypothetical protein
VSREVLTVSSPEGAASTVQQALAALAKPACIINSTDSSSSSSSSGPSPAAAAAAAETGVTELTVQACPGSRVVTLVFPHDVSWTPAAAAAAPAAGLNLRQLSLQQGPASLQDSPGAQRFLSDCAAALVAAAPRKAAIVLGGAAMLMEGRLGVEGSGRRVCCSGVGQNSFTPSLAATTEVRAASFMSTFGCRAGMQACAVSALLARPHLTLLLLPPPLLPPLLLPPLLLSCQVTRWPTPAASQLLWVLRCCVTPSLAASAGVLACPTAAGCLTSLRRLLLSWRSMMLCCLWTSGALWPPLDTSESC